MEDFGTQIQLLIDEGEKFTYENFAALEPAARWAVKLTPRWISWMTRTENALTRMCASNSSATALLKEGLAVSVIGFGPEQFESAKSLLLEALKEALRISQKDTFGERVDAPTVTRSASTGNKVFIVHGHDHRAKAELEVFLRENKLDPVVLHREPDEGKTIIEKFEKHSDVGYAFIILTPDDLAYAVEQDSRPDKEREKERRARQNVIFEFGYFVGKLQRSRVCCLYTGDVKLPSDLGGLVYKKFEHNIEEVAYGILKDLRAAGYQA